MIKPPTALQVQKLSSLGYNSDEISSLTLNEAGDILRSQLNEVAKRSNISERPELIDYVMVRSEVHSPKYNDTGVRFLP